MKTKILVLLLTCIALTFATTSCSKDGDTGPAGPAGIDGVDGQDGADGVDGTNGNANVVSVLVPGVDITIGRNTISLPELTEDIFNNGFVIGYVTLAGNTTA